MILETSRKSAILAGLLATLAAGVSPAAGELVYGNVSGWTVSTDPAQGYLCSAEARYEGGTFLRVGFASSHDSSLVLTVGDPSWEGTIFPAEHLLELRFDDDDALTLTGTGVVDQSGYRLVVPTELGDAFLQDFGSRYSFSIGAVEDAPVVLSLGGSLAATRMLAECRAAFTAAD